MSTTTASTTATATSSKSSLARSARFGTFAATFGIVGPIAYVIVAIWNWPLFTFHPATNRLVWGWEAARSGEGPAMYWYGWTGTVILVAALVGILAMLLPESVTKKIPLALVWILPILAIPFVIYLLLPFFTHA
jgi:hypothetical protein